MTKSLWSFVERLLPRFSSSLLLIILAYFTNPAVVGIYAWGALFYTLLMSLSDSPMRHIAVRAIRNKRGSDFVRKCQCYLVFVAPTLFSLLVSIVYFYSESSLRHFYWTLLPLNAALVFLMLNLRNIALLQGKGSWGALAGAQLRGAVAILAIGIPLTFFFQSPIGSTVGVAAGELAVYLKCRKTVAHSKPLQSNLAHTHNQPYISYSRDLITITLYSGLAWAQGQLDRVFIGIIGGATSLGLISFGLAISRSLGDAIASSNANVLRSDLADIRTVQDGMPVVNAVLRRGIWLATASAFTVAVPVNILFDYFLDPQWDSTLKMVPILSLIAIPAVLSWCVPVINSTSSAGKRSLLGPISGIIVSPFIALLALVDLQLFAAGVVTREFVLVLINCSLLGKWAPWGELIRAIIHSTSLALLFLFLFPILF